MGIGEAFSLFEWEKRDSSRRNWGILRAQAPHQPTLVASLDGRIQAVNACPKTINRRILK
jgi:hypothetical protein